MTKVVIKIDILGSIYRQLVKRPKGKPLEEFLKDRFQKVEEKISQAVEKLFKRKVQN